MRFAVQVGCKRAGSGSEWRAGIVDAHVFGEWCWHSFGGAEPSAGAFRSVVSGGIVVYQCMRSAANMLGVGPSA